MNRNAAALLGITGAITVITTVNRLGGLDVRTLASTPESLSDGRVWLLASSAVLADRPAVASILGFLVVGLAALAICGARVVWISALLGQLAATVVVYLGIGLIRVVDHDAYQGVLSHPDYGTSAIIAAWIGAAAYVVWSKRLRRTAIALIVVSAVIGYLCKSDLTVLDSEHGFALLFGAVTAGYAPRFSLRLNPAAASPTT